MTAILTAIWNYKEWVLLGVVVIAAGIYISYLKIDHNLMTAKVTEQKSQIEALARNNQILEQNALAVKEQDKQLRKIQKTAEQVQKMVAGIPTETREVLKKDETLTLINDCLVDYANTGVLPDSCGAVKALLPITRSAAAVEGGGEPAQ